VSILAQPVFEVIMDNSSRSYVIGGFIIGAMITITSAIPYLRNPRRRGYGQEADPPSEHIELLDERPQSRTVLLHEGMRDGLEGCIGNTPLIRIKSLSEATQCNIFGKAEVNVSCE
jgi:cysteine synthase